MDSYGIGLFVSVLGQRSPPVTYPAGAEQAGFAVNWQNGRHQQLMEALPRIVSALLRGDRVALHCLNSYHRAPLGLAAVLKSLFGFEPRHFLRFLATKRRIHKPYGTHDPIGKDIGDTIRWIQGLRCWYPRRSSAVNDGRREAACSRPGSSCDPVPPGLGADLSPADRSRLADEQLEKDRGQYLYRAMRPDGQDLSCPHPASSQGLRGLEFCVAAIKAVETGSRVPSPFLHFSWDFVQARWWHTRGKADRGEKNGYVARVKVSDLEALAASSQGALSSPRSGEPVAVLGEIIDLSQPRKAHAAFGSFRLTNEVSDLSEELSLAFTHSEVLVPWRGKLPSDLFEPVDLDTGMGVASIPINIQYIHTVSTYIHTAVQ